MLVFHAIYDFVDIRIKIRYITIWGMLTTDTLRQPRKKYEPS